jgi:MFS family permease
MTHSWRTVALLAAALALGASTGPLVVLAGGIVGRQLAPSPVLATLPITTMVLGLAVCTVPAALLMGRIGRRAGFILGAIAGVVGSLTAAVATSSASFVGFCAATFVLGSAAAFAQQYRFAAAESVSGAQAGRAVSFVLLGGIVAGALGPEIGRIGRGLLATEFAGAFVIAAGVQLVGVALLAGLRPPPTSALGTTAESPPRVLALLRRPSLALAIAAAATAYAAMSFLMTATPISMHVIDGHSLDDTARVIQSHVIAMYAPSLVSGYLTDRLGERRMMIGGALALLACSAFTSTSHTVGAYWLGLVLLGVGWNLLFVGATVLLTRSYAPSERFRAQAVNDFVVFGSQACASLASGAVLHRWGWTTSSLTVVPVVGVLLMLLAGGRSRSQTLAGSQGAQA